MSKNGKAPRHRHFRITNKINMSKNYTVPILCDINTLRSHRREIKENYPRMPVPYL